MIRWLSMMLRRPVCRAGRGLPAVGLQHGPGGANAVPLELQGAADDGLRAGLVRWDDAGGDAAWLVDPNGFVVLRYAPGFDPGDLRTDLARLLKIN